MLKALYDLPLLVSSKNSENSYVKSCPGNLAFYQHATRSVMLDQSESRENFIVVRLEVKAKVNFDETKKIWYRDSQIFESKQGMFK